MFLRNKSRHKHTLKIDSIKAEASDDVLLEGITIEHRIKAYYKLHALRRIRKFLTIGKAKVLSIR